MLITKRRDILTFILTLLPLMIGCSRPPDERLVALSEQANQRQQAQNETIARQTEKTAELSRGFIDAEAKARQELLTLQKQIVDAQSREDMQRIHEQIVERDAAGRRELDALQHQAHAAFAKRTQAVEHQRDLLEQERRQIAAERQRAPVVAEAIRFVGGLIVCSLPLLVVVYLLRSLRCSSSEVDTATIEVLVEELVAERPRLLASGTGAPSLPRA